jgi:tripartite-type tricarboxylate transporter receptor subunit TctC
MTFAFTRRTMLTLALAASTGLAGLPAAAADWAPSKPIEMVIMGGTGGGADRLARFFQAIIQEEGLTDMPVIPVNKGGGSGAEALRYLHDKSGDPHVIMATLNSYYTTPLRTDIGVDIETFTPLARMALDTFVLWVNADSGIETLDQFVAAVKAADGTFKMGGTGTGAEDSLVTAMLEKQFDLKFTYVPFDGGGDVAKAVVGGHVDSTVNNPSEAIGFFQAGKVRPIAAFTAERIAGLEDVPTMAELGHPLEYTMQRSFVAPAAIPPEATAYYTDLFQKLAATEKWQAYMAENALLGEMLTGADLQSYFLAERQKHADLLKQMGELQGS